tara:strand:- start:109 stop:336 length:228 start_codon:yes stop_codon:yes gene_type:complete
MQIAAVTMAKAQQADPTLSMMIGVRKMTLIVRRAKKVTHNKKTIVQTNRMSNASVGCTLSSKSEKPGPIEIMSHV